MHEVQSTSPTPTTAISATSCHEQEILGTASRLTFAQVAKKAMKEATAYGNGQSAKENEKRWRKSGSPAGSEIITLTPEQDAASARRWTRLPRMCRRVGQPLIDEFLKGNEGRDQLTRNKRSGFAQAEALGAGDQSDRTMGIARSGAVSFRRRLTFGGSNVSSHPRQA